MKNVCQILFRLNNYNLHKSQKESELDHGRCKCHVYLFAQYPIFIQIASFDHCQTDDFNKMCMNFDRFYNVVCIMLDQWLIIIVPEYNRDQRETIPKNGSKSAMLNLPKFG